MELIKTEHQILFHSVYNDTLMVSEATKSEILLKYDLIFAPSHDYFKFKF